MQMKTCRWMQNSQYYFWLYNIWKIKKNTLHDINLRCFDDVEDYIAVAVRAIFMCGCVYLLTFWLGDLFNIDNCPLKYLTFTTNTVMKSHQQSLDVIFILSIHSVSFFPEAAITKESWCIPKCRQHNMKMRPYVMLLDQFVLRSTKVK